MVIIIISSLSFQKYAFITLYLDYCNSLYLGLPQSYWHLCRGFRMQRLDSYKAKKKKNMIISLHF